MCGVGGIVLKQKTAPIDLNQYADKLTAALEHRGPDGSGFHLVENDFLAVHTRLAIVDVAGGLQPMFSSDEATGIVYNGEIYNYLELRTDLESLGYEFTSNSDTEVIIKSFEEYGEKAFDKLNGMFAFFLWNQKTGNRYLVRDPLGVKPLYFYEDQKVFAFSSEVRGLLALDFVDNKLSSGGIERYLTFRYPIAPNTLFEKISILEPGTFIRWSSGKKLNLPYARQADYEPKEDLSAIDAKYLIDSCLANAVESQLMGEVPIGVTLSGGVDSSAIAAFVHKAGANLTTYNIGFPEVNEFEYSEQVAKKLGLQHVTVETSVDEFLQNFDEVLGAMDHPMADPACFPLYLLGRRMKQDVTVVLSGEGGDEVFGGYPQYVNGPHSGELNRFRAFEDFLKRSYYFLDNKRYQSSAVENESVFSPYKYFNESAQLDSMLNFDLHTWMPDNLMMKADKILMAHSLEGRFPFLDHKLLRAVAKLPAEMKIHPHGTQKWLLKEVVRDYLPATAVDRAKMGFSVPLGHILLGVKDKAMTAVERAKKTELVDHLNLDQVDSLISSYYRCQHDEALRVWTFFVLLHWVSNILPQRHQAD